MKRLIKEKKAITLIALVITIVVLVILAAVVISMTVGNDGLIARAIKAANDYKNAQEKDKQGINDLYGELLVASDGTISGLTTEKLQEIINTSIDEKTAHLRATVKSQEESITALQSVDTQLTTRISTLEDMNTYSNTAKRVGTYVDGKPLYRITVTGTSSATNAGFATIWTGASNTKVVFAEGYVTASNNVRCPIVYDDAGGSGLTYHYNNDCHTLMVQSKGSLFTGRPLEVTIWYTTNN